MPADLPVRTLRDFVPPYDEDEGPTTPFGARVVYTELDGVQVQVFRRDDWNAENPRPWNTYRCWTNKELYVELQEAPRVGPSLESHRLLHTFWYAMTGHYWWLGHAFSYNTIRKTVDVLYKHFKEALLEREARV